MNAIAEVVKIRDAREDINRMTKDVENNQRAFQMILDYRSWLVTTRCEKGTGLGLYICKRIIEAHGGKIWGENNVDQGLLFL